jgi:2-phosphoglycolate phosphatase
MGRNMKNKLHIDRKYDILIFDFDGTLMDTARDVYKSCNYALLKMNLKPVTFKQVKNAIGPGVPNFTLRNLGKENLHRVDEFLSNFRAHYENHILDETTSFPGIDELLHSLDGQKLAVASNKPTRHVKNILKGLNLLSHFDLLVGPEDVSKSKPDPEMVHFIMNSFRGSTESTIIIGDTDNDILAGKAAGVATCAVTWGYGALYRLEELAPDYMISQPLELLQVINNEFS